MMFRLFLGFALLVGGCGAVDQPQWVRTVAAYEVSLPTSKDHKRFLALLEAHAEQQGFHVDAATEAELRTLSQVAPITFKASVWRGDDDDESMASAMDSKEHLGRIWISFPRGKDPELSDRFRTELVSDIVLLWPDTRALPIMPNGAIPLARDLARENDRYIVRPSAAAKYELIEP